MKWKILNKQIPKNKEDVLKIILDNRGLKTKKEINSFFNPPDPLTISLKEIGISKNEVKKTLDLIKKTIKLNGQIIVYGDYDADGITATAILWEVLYRLKANVLPYIPSRVDEGYGLSEKGINNLIEKYHPIENLLIITVDHGIVANKQVEYAKKKRIQVIITDHHVPPKKLPKANSIIHTTKLSGSGVSWVLAKELIKSFKEKNINPLDYLDLAAIGSISDLVPLTDINRTLVKFGLKVLNKTKRLGLLELINDSGLTLGDLGNYEIGYILGPRLNAMGRLEHALDSLRLLCTKNTVKAVELSKKLGLKNRERQELTIKTTEHARLNSKFNPLANGGRSKLIYVIDESYNQGIIGLVAGKLVEEFYRPAIVIAKGEKISKASARSISGFNIIEALRKFSDLLIDCGGHPMAAGFTIENKNLEKLRIKLEILAEELLPAEKLEKELRIDCQINLADLSNSLFEEIAKLSPFGIGNPEPVFVSEARIIDLRLVGREQKHLKLVLDDPKTRKTENAIGFNLSSLSKKIKVNDVTNIVYSLTLNEWNGSKSIQLKIKDINNITD